VTRPVVDNTPPLRSKVTGALAALACAACCAIPLLIAAGVGVVALGMWWLHRRRGARRAAGAHRCTDADCAC